MNLAAYHVRTSIAVSDIAGASEFYEGQLGPVVPDTEAQSCRGSRSAECAEGAPICGKISGIGCSWLVRQR